MEYNTYLFDFDLTLADSSKGIVKCYRNVLNRHNYLSLTDEEIKRTIGKTLEESFAILTGISELERLIALRKEYVKEADKYMTANTFLYPETLEVLQQLKDKGKQIGVISTKFRYRIQDLFRKYEVNDIFLDLIIGGEDVKEHKPSPEGLLKAIEQLGTQRSNTLYIGDSTVDAETAQRAKVDFAGVLHGNTTQEELEHFPSVLIATDLNGIL